MKLNSTIWLYSVYITFNKSTAKLNMTDSHDTSSVYDELLIDLTAESGSFWTAAVIDCQRAISGVMISAECRHTNCNYFLTFHVYFQQI